MSTCLLVSSASLDVAAGTMGPSEVRDLSNGVAVTAAQLRAAAQILRDAEPSVIREPKRFAGTEERPGFIDAARQDGSDALVFDVGLLPSTSYLIDRAGTMTMKEGE